MENLEPGLYWAKALWHNIKGDSGIGDWELVEIRQDSRKDLEVFIMGWDCSEPLTNYTDYVKADLKTPDGELYKPV
jgi:hypothetical protein